MYLSDEVKIIVLEAAAKAEDDFLAEVARNGARGIISPVTETYYKGVYQGLYNIVLKLGLEDAFLKWKVPKGGRYDDVEK